jgi:hypothetical protein
MLHQNGWITVVVFQGSTLVVNAYWYSEEKAARAFQRKVRREARRDRVTDRLIACRVRPSYNNEGVGTPVGGS